MDADELSETTMDPAHRSLRRIRVEDAEAAERVFDLLMGSVVAPRKDFIIAGAQALDKGMIDAVAIVLLTVEVDRDRYTEWVTDLTARTSEGDTAPAASSASGIPLRRKVGAYVSLTKPRVMELLLVTTLPTMFFAQGGLPDFWTALATMFGGAFERGPPLRSTVTSTGTWTG